MNHEDEKLMQEMRELLKPTIGKTPGDIRETVKKAIERLFEGADQDYKDDIKVDVQKGERDDTLIANISVPRGHPLAHSLMLRDQIVEARRQVDIDTACKELLCNHAVGYKITVPEVMPLVNAFYAHPANGAGGCLHIVLDDGNIDDDDVQFCVDYAIEHGDRTAELLAKVLLKMSKTQRKRLYADGGKYL